ncbi:MAG: hypothetical protein SNI45_04315 [Rikenellaceae bacterium]
MKKVTLLAAICMTFISLSGFAQMGGGGMGGGGGRGGGQGGQGGGQGAPPQQQSQRNLDINFIGSAGFFEIDSEEALKKLKIKKNKPKEEAVVAAIETYTAAYEELIPQHRTDIDVLEFAKEAIEEATGDMTTLRAIMAAVNKSMMVVRPKLVEIHKTLNLNMAEILNEKEMEKWTKFYKSICKDNTFDPDARLRGRPEGEEGEGPEGEHPEGEHPEGGRPPME